jgi:hypothetical protein
MLIGAPAAGGAESDASADAEADEATGDGADDSAVAPDDADDDAADAPGAFDVQAASKGAPAAAPSRPRADVRRKSRREYPEFMMVPFFVGVANADAGQVERVLWNGGA